MNAPPVPSIVNRRKTIKRLVCIPAGSALLDGELSIPPGAYCLVLFVHGSGSSRHSVRNQFVARVLQENGCAMLLFELLTRDEEVEDACTGRFRFNIDLLTRGGHRELVSETKMQRNERNPQMKAKLEKKTRRSNAQLVHFEYTDAGANTVCIAGTFNDWQPEVSEMIHMGDGKWMKGLELPPGTYEYRFVVDGRWVTDAHCARTTPNPFGELNSLLVVPDPRQLPAALKPTSVTAEVLP
jgi:hypothetical protein